MLTPAQHGVASVDTPPTAAAQDEEGWEFQIGCQGRCCAGRDRPTQGCIGTRQPGPRRLKARHEDSPGRQVLTGDQVVHKTYAATALSQHYGADEQIAGDIVAHLRHGAEIPVSTSNALEACILALSMDEARMTRKVVDLRPIWDRFYEALPDGPA